MLLHPVNKRFTAEVQVLSSPSLVSAEFLQGANNQFLFQSIQADPIRWEGQLKRADRRVLRTQELRQIPERNFGSTAEDDNPFQDVLQLTDVTRPGVTVKVR